MNKCPITYEALSEGVRYSKRGLSRISPHLSNLKDFPYTVEQQRTEAIKRASKMSIQGVQEKLSVVLSIKEEVFNIIDNGGRFILKPQHYLYQQVPENEDLTMKLAGVIDLEVPAHGLIYCADNTLTYFIRRFDRYNKSRKYSVEDFAQLSGGTRDTKYDSSMEQVAAIIDRFTTFPVVEKAKLFKLTIFNFLVGNEDAHLKNFSIITKEGKNSLSPCYDLLNSTIAISDQEEVALPLNGKKRNLRKPDLIDYFGLKRLGLNLKVIDSVLKNIAESLQNWKQIIDKSFLGDKGKQDYWDVITSRRGRLGL